MISMLTAKKQILLLLLFSFLYACNHTTVEPKKAKQIANVMEQVTDIMTHDVTNPPLAARFFSYISLSGIQAIAPFDTEAENLLKKINAYPYHSETIELVDVDPHYAALFSMYYTAQKIQPSGKRYDSLIDSLTKNAKKEGLNKASLAATQKYAGRTSGIVLEYLGQDNYNKNSSLPRYKVQDFEGSWKPTPPGYFPPVEPYFNLVRPFLIDSASQFLSSEAIPFQTSQDSDFYKLLHAVYAQELTTEKKEIASFWDCNPFALDDMGHLMVGLKKISPGAHWIGIANIASMQKNLSFEETLYINAILSMTLHDGFLACWDEKYRSNRIRPESAIRQLIDPSYQPLLQTPPFPEYLSGHSVVSTAAAEVLSHYFGDSYAYVDTVENKYGLEERAFSSFREAALEASISRFYGGIHYMDGIENGQVMGEKIGQKILEKVSEKNLQTFKNEKL